MATFSNSKATVIGCASFFENLWRQSELVKKLKESEELQKDFVHIAAHELKKSHITNIGIIWSFNAV